MKYIDSEKLIAEIERRKRFYERTQERPHQDDPEFSTSYAIASALKELRSFITTLQQEQPEVDFETEYAKFTNDPDAMEYAFPIDLADYKDFARHFYELGIYEMRKRITNPDYNQKVIEKMKSEYPVNEFNARK